MASKPNKPNLEQSLSEITSLIETMEKGNLSLEQSLEHFERGVNLIKNCQKILNEAEQKVQILMKSNGNDQLETYENTEE